MELHGQGLRRRRAPTNGAHEARGEDPAAQGPPPETLAGRLEEILHLHRVGIEDRAHGADDSRQRRGVAPPEGRPVERGNRHVRSRSPPSEF